ncbi:MAG: RNA polymerase factor sigma-54 [Gammaproteobacteria bacterium]|nr:RNA polymerase factor sigma-54 [Gammaproteobacteria bacterium]
MKQKLQLRIGQQLNLTPQLQQAIRLLQLSTLELQHEIQDALDSNMMLELTEEEREVESDTTTTEILNSASDTQEQQESEPEQDFGDNIPDDLPVDASWDSVYPDSVNQAASSGDFQELDYQRSSSLTLRDHLLWQLEFLHLSERDLAIATAIIYTINDDGYLGLSVDEIFNGLQGQIDELESDEVSAALCIIQSFDPPGVGARNLAECLRIQLEQLPMTIPWRNEALRLVIGGLDYLAANKVNSLQRLLGVSKQQLPEVISLVRSLNPTPSSLIVTTEPEYVVPDVIVCKVGDQWTVRLNASLTPRLRINSTYSKMISSDKSSREDRSCMRTHLQEARWFIKSLENRNDTILRVARSVVEKQQDFFEKGPKFMKPLILRTIAEEVGMHESTISRVTTNKYMDTPNGIFEFKYFFSSHVAMEDGAECSSTAIKAFLKELIDQEDSSKPLSDSKLVELLKQRNIIVARRTIAKYREMMGVLPSGKRKRII